MKEVETAIVGAGVSGLAAAAFLGPRADVAIFERDDEIGGYCKTVKRDGFVWDYSGHFFHFKHPWVEQWLRERMEGQSIRTVKKRSFISFANRWVDFPFQKNIHQLPQPDFIECLYDLYFAQTSPKPPHNFKAMLSQRFGQGICDKFLIPYNEKLYATDLSLLDVEAMGRFFPHARFDEIVRNMREAADDSYNATFTYPAEGAAAYVAAIASRVRPETIRLGEAVSRIDLKNRVLHTTLGDAFRFNRLISSAPLPATLAAAGVATESVWSSNQVLVFNLGFDRKGPSDVHWLYVPDRRRCFYRVGFYDNIFDTPRMSLYVEIGMPAGSAPDLVAAKREVLAGLAAEGIVKDHRLVAEHSVMMNPAYVHITAPSIEAVARARKLLERSGVFPIGRYGGWTYCSIEDNILEAKALVDRLTGGEPVQRND